MKSRILVLSILATALMLCQAYAVSQMTLKFAMNTSDVFDDKTFGSGLQAFCTVYDIDGDGVNEILYPTRRGDSNRLWCFDQNGEFKWIFPPIEEEGLPGHPGSKPSIVDVNNDGIYEIAFSTMSRPGRMYVLNPDASVVWMWDNPTEAEGDSRILGAPQAFDVDGDGFVEFFQGDNNGYLHRLDHAGNLVWTSAKLGRGNQGHPTICDFDRDGVDEVLYASNDHNLYCLSSADGREEWRYDTGANMQTNQVFVADVDEDGEYEALVWNDLGLVFCVSFFGTEEWRWSTPTQTVIYLCQAMGDVDGDGALDMVINTGIGAFCIDVSGAGRTKWSLNRTDLGQQGLIPEGVAGSDAWRSYNLIVDIDGDGAQEVIMISRSSGGAAPIVVDAATGELEAYYYNEHINSINGGWFGDVDQDGISEYMFEGDGFSHPETQHYCVTLGGKFPADAYWPEYYHSAYPVDDQNDQSWLKLKASYSNSLFFPVPEALFGGIAVLFAANLLKRRW